MTDGLPGRRTGGASTTSPGAGTDRVWGALLRAAHGTTSTSPTSPGPGRSATGGAGEADLVDEGRPDDALRGFARLSGLATSSLDASGRQLLERYGPLCLGSRRPRVLVHLAQSVDGRIATTSGASRYLSGEADLEHAHRLRALFDGILVGAGTVASDDPRLTCRRVPGPSPTRIVLDPRGRLDLAAHRVFQDGAAPTLLVRGTTDGGAAVGSRATSAPGAAPGVRVLSSPVGPSGQLDLRRLLDVLAAHGLGRIFVEGGGVTVSRFLQAGLVDRLQLTVAPVVLGSGRPAVKLPTIEGLGEALRPPCRIYRLGEDVLFDFDLSSSSDRGAL